MTSDELKNLLESSANALDAAAAIYPMDLDRELIKILYNLDDNSVNVISAFTKIPAQKIRDSVPNLIKLLDAVQQLLGTSEHEKISNLCRNLASRPFLLGIIVKFI